MSLAEAIDQLGELATEIKREAFTDDKTSLNSALALHQEGRLNNAGGSESYVVVFGDLNDFKHINDDYSHEAGDVALRLIRHRQRSAVRDTGWTRIVGCQRAAHGMSCLFKDIPMYSSGGLSDIGKLVRRPGI